MAESVTVDQGSISVTTNTSSEADLRAELEAPTIPPEGETPAQAAQRARDERGRYTKAEGQTPPAEVAATVEAPEPVPDPDTPGRRRDDTLPRHNPIARINKAMAQKAEAERRAAALEAELQQYRQRQPTEPAPSRQERPQTTGEPQFEAFADQPDPYTAYLQAWTRWDRSQAIAQARSEWETQQVQQQRGQTFAQRLTSGKAAYPDFDSVLQNADTLGLQVSAVMQEAIADSPKAADLVYFLATHPEECHQLAEESQQTPVAAAAVMRRLLESQLAPRAVPSNGSGAAARATLSTAKPPVTPVGSSPVMSDDPPGEAASAADHARYWNRRLKVPGTK